YIFLGSFVCVFFFFFFSSRRRHTRFSRDWSSDVCSSDLPEYHPSCFENLYTNLAPFGIKPDDIPTAFNIFMNVVFDETGKLQVLPPTSVAHDFVLFEAEMDLIIGLTACSAEDSNGGTFKPIH